MCFLFLDSPEELFHLLVIYCLPHQDNSPLAKIQNNNSSLAVSLTIYPLIPASHPTIHFIHLSIFSYYLHPSICLSIRPSVSCPSVCLSICLSFYLSVYFSIVFQCLQYHLQVIDQSTYPLLRHTVTFPEISSVAVTRTATDTVTSATSKFSASAVRDLNSSTLSSGGL